MTGGVRLVNSSEPPAPRTGPTFIQGFFSDLATIPLEMSNVCLHFLRNKIDISSAYGKLGSR